MLVLLCAAVMGNAATAQQSGGVCSDKSIIPVQRGLISDRNGVILADNIKKEGEAVPRRNYTFPRQLCHVLGHVDHTDKPKGGVEAYYHSQLSGSGGTSSGAGLNLQLTIDMNLQKIAEEELDAGLRRFRAERGCMIVMNPKNGDILAMVNRPSYDLCTGEIITPNGTFAQGSVKDARGNDITGEFNMSCRSVFEPGAVFNVVSLASSLDQKLLNINSAINCSPFSVGHGSPPINDRPYNYGDLPVWGVLAKSSRPGTARIALLSNWSRYKEYLEKFGLCSAPGIDLPGSNRSVIANGSNAVYFSRIAYGNSIAVSPLHMAVVYATIANNGVRMTPRLVNRMTAADGSVFSECKPAEGLRVISAETAADLRFALETATRDAKGNGDPVRRGIATKAAIPGFRIGGKPGTSRKVNEKGYYNELYTVSFAGILPIDDPKLVIMTVIDEPHPTDCNPGGGTVAAPIFRAAAERMIQTLNITPSNPEAYGKYLAEKEQGAAH